MKLIQSCLIAPLLLVVSVLFGGAWHKYIYTSAVHEYYIRFRASSKTTLAGRFDIAIPSSRHACGTRGISAAIDLKPEMRQRLKELYQDYYALATLRHSYEFAEQQGLLSLSRSYFTGSLPTNFGQSLAELEKQLASSALPDLDCIATVASEDNADV